MRDSKTKTELQYSSTTTLFGRLKESRSAQPGNRTPVSTVGGYYDTTTPAAQKGPLLRSGG
uniref:Uncharacterized protein n=1 Tax=Physcomitrium patens TaxID=3218 RepID=A0A2K1II87_PHYPA|nr:hypothetical protein PHYPA_027679 [Physcomitrium patens]